MNMAQFKTLFAFVILFNLFMNTYGLSSVKTCRERLDSLESIVESLKEGFAKHKTNNDREDMMLKIKLEGENRELKSRLKSLEAIVMTSSRRMEELEARIVELESTDHFPKFEFDELKTKSNQTDVPKENTLINKNSETSTTDNLMKIHVQRNNLATESRVGQIKRIPYIPKERSATTTGTQPSPTEHTAFYAYISIHRTNAGIDQVIKFDTVVTNIGNHYSSYSGKFSAPQHGVYVFTWTIHCLERYLYTSLVVNGRFVGSTNTDARGASGVRSTTGIVVVEVNQGDRVFVATHPTNDLYSNPNWRPSFSGWKLF